MEDVRKKHSAQEKTKIALEALNCPTYSMDCLL